MFKKQEIDQHIKVVNDFPKKGIAFRDITPLFKRPDLVENIIDEFAKLIKNQKIDYIVGIESRGYLFGVPLSLKLNIPFVLIRKANKLPNEVYKQEIELEYGSTTIELQKTDIKEGSNVVIIDDLLATGGTIYGAEKLVMQAKANPVISLFLIELKDIKNKKKLISKSYSLLQY